MDFLLVNLKHRYKSLSFWNKLLVWSAVAFVIGLPVGLITIGLSVSKPYIGVNIDIQEIFEKIEREKIKKSDNLLISQIFWLRYIKNASIELGPCPSDDCFKFVLGEVKLKNRQIIQRIYISGKGFGIYSNPESKGILQFEKLIGFKGAWPGFSITDDKMFLSFVLQKGATIEIFSPKVHIKIRIVDMAVEALKIKLELIARDNKTES